ncbi:MAG: flagellar hook protein FlgE [Burkholderiales bacterium]|nr:flagellar hook protein FlgE [Burkholderiales bacterium]MCE7876481.1 flagellar hook protein FlgE [Betaproteobacteria bacterium PRO3]
MGFQQGLSGLNAAAASLDVIGNNVANAQTVGFKAAATLFADVYANSLASAGGMGAGIGVRVAAVQPDLVQGNIRTTSNPLDLAINGNGFFRVESGGSISYTRNGQFHLDKDGFIVNASGARLTGYGVDAGGTLLVANPGPLQVSAQQLQATATTEGDIGLNLDARDAVISAPFDISDPTTYNRATAITIYDSLGNSHAMSTYYVKTAANTWSVYGALDGVAIAGTLGTLAFTTDGTLDTGATTLPFPVSAPLANGATTPFAFTLDFANATQFGSPFAVDTLNQDGFAAGALAGYAVSDDGTILGRYSNGQSRTLGQVMLAAFANPQGLQPLGNNAWGETAASGQPLPGTPGTSQFGVLQSGAIEESNVDLTQELVEMITAQRTYQANAQTIKTQDQVLNTLVNLR